MVKTTDIRNVVIAGHSGTGKTTLFERLLFAAGVIGKPEHVGSGKTVSGSAPEEIEHAISVYAAIANFEREGKKINLFDTPGSSDFAGEVMLALRASEFALLACEAKAGAQIGLVKWARAIKAEHKPHGFCVTKLEEDRASFRKTLDDIKEKLNVELVPVTIPMGEGAAFKGVIDALQETAYFINADGTETAAPVPAEYKDALIDARIRIMEAAADGDEILLEKYILIGALDVDEVYRGLNKALAANLYVPAFAISAMKNSGLLPLLDFIAHVAPSPAQGAEAAFHSDVNGEQTPIMSDAPLRAMVIKTVFDQFSGKLSWLKIIAGKLSADSDIYNINENKKERAGKLYTAAGKKLNETRELCAGEIGIITKLASFKTGDTLAADVKAAPFVPHRLPEPVHSLAVNALSKKDDVKLGEFLNRAAEEDKTFRYTFSGETKETVISGMGERHINIMLHKARQTHKIEVETRLPRVAYRETITKHAAAEYTHKKQTGGHGQYGKVMLEIDPLPRGESYQFINAIFGGAVPKNYIPGIEKGIAEGMARGVLAGYPAVDVAVKLTDGKYHQVDSSELSFKLAARNAFRQAMKIAGPVLLEPVMTLTVLVEQQYLGDVMSDLSGKRGKIQGQQSLGGGIEEIRALVPHAELLRYSIDLRSLTSGTGSFGIAFNHYEPVSGRIADDIIKAAQSFAEEETDE